MASLILGIVGTYHPDLDSQKYRQARSEYRKYNYTLERAPNFAEAISQLNQREYMLVVILLDFLEGTNVIPYISAIRSIQFMPILTISKEYNPQLKTNVIDYGADEYISRPETPKELFASSKALIRRYTEYNKINPPDLNVFVCGDCAIFPLERRVMIKNSEISLTPMEFDLLQLFLEHQGQTFTYKQLARQLWGTAAMEEHTLLWTLVKRLRRQLKALNISATALKTSTTLGTDSSGLHRTNCKQIVTELSVFCQYCPLYWKK